MTRWRLSNARLKENRDGALADYIPELAAVDPDSFGLAIATVDGKLHTIGDANVPFTIQSVSKAFVYCLALELVGRDALLKRVGGRAERRCVQRHRIRSTHQPTV